MSRRICRGRCAALSLLCAAQLACPGRTSGPEESPDAGADADAGACSVASDYGRPQASKAPTREDGQTPQLACAETPEVWPRSVRVSMGGCLDVFGLGEKVDSQTIKLAVYAADQNPAVESPAYGETSVLTNTPAAVACEKGAFYKIEDVPTATPLLVKVYDARTDSAKVVVDSYQYGVYLDARLEADGYVPFEANVVYAATYQALPITAGRSIDGMDDITDGVGRGAIAGEAHDCTGAPLANVAIGGPCFDALSKIIYTKGEDCDEADRSRLTTGSCGIFAVFNVAPGLHAVEGYFLDGSASHLLGRGEIYVFPDSVTIYSPEGLPPTTGDVDAGTPDTAMPDTATADTATADTATADTATADTAAADAGAEDVAAEDQG